MDEDRPPKLRLYVTAPLAEGAAVGVEPAQAHYLANVMRLRTGETVGLFNGRDGEWRARIDGMGRGWCSLAVETLLRPQQASPDLWLRFAPIKRARLDFIAEKATELGVSAIQPVITRRTIVTRVNEERLRANAVEAAEQTERLDVPEVRPAMDFHRLLAGWPTERRLIVLDETGGGAPIAEALAGFERGAPAALLTGPEGGFAETELDALRDLPFVTPVGLGPRILRADTAALAALACWQALCGDWHRRPAFRAAD